MKENNKFSLSAFFCSLCSKSRIFMFFLLGAPFFLVQFFTLKVCASSVAVPGADGLLVTPSGGINSPIHNVLKMDTGSINSSLWVALGLDPLDLYDIMEDANEAYQDGNQVVYDAIIDALNEQDSGSGDLLDYVIQSSFQASSQSGYVGKLSIPDDVWNRINKATKNGLSLRIPGSTSPELSSFSSFVKSYLPSFSDSYINDAFSLVNLGASAYIYESYNERNNHYYELIVGSGTISGNIYTFSNTSYPVNGFNYYGYFGIYDPLYERTLANSYVSTNTLNLTGYANNNLSLVSSYGAYSNKHVGVASDFISNKANESYDIVSKSSTYNPDTGKIEGARSINLITPAYLSQLVASLRDGILSLPEALQRLGIGAIDTDQSIPIGVGFDIDTLSHVVAQSVPQEATAAATREAFQQLDNFTFYTPDDFIGVPSVSPLPVAMNWLAVQMQTMMSLTSFQNCWVVLSTLAVLSLLVGIIRLSK